MADLNIESFIIYNIELELNQDISQGLYTIAINGKYYVLELRLDNSWFGYTIYYVKLTDVETGKMAESYHDYHQPQAIFNAYSQLILSSQSSNTSSDKYSWLKILGFGTGLFLIPAMFQKS